MKKLSLFFVSMFALLAVACTETGADDNGGTNGGGNGSGDAGTDGPGLYFSPENISYHSFSPDAPVKEFIVTVMRTGELNEAKDYKIKSTDEDMMFSVSPLEFEVGAKEATVKVTFTGTTQDLRYSLILSVEEFSDEFSDNPAVMSFSAAIEDWTRVVGENGEQTGIWCDEFFTSYVMAGFSYPEKEVVIEEKTNEPGLYRVKNVYDRDYLEALLGFDPDDKSQYNVMYEASDEQPVYIYIDATDPDNVFIPHQEMGVIVNEKDEGKILIGSLVPDNNFSGRGVYGTLESGYFKFPAGSLYMAHELTINNTPPTLYAGNEDGMFYIMLPGGSVPPDPNAKPIDNGEYSVPYIYNNDSQSGDTTFTLTANPSNTSKFTITGLFDSPAADDVKFNCVLDTDKNQLKVTPDVGFLLPYKDVDASGKESYAFLGGDEVSGEGAWLINLKVDGDKFVMVDFATDAGLYTANMTTGNFTGCVGMIETGAKITFNGAAPAASTCKEFSNAASAKVISSHSLNR